MSAGPVILLAALFALLTSIIIGPLGQALVFRSPGRTPQHPLATGGSRSERAARTGPSEATTKTFTSRFSVGTRVRVGDRERLAGILAEWPYDNRLTIEQLEYAGRRTVVASVTVRPGGHVFYGLDDAPGLWHDACIDAEE